MTGTALRDEIKEAEGDPAKLERLIWKARREATESQAVIDRLRDDLRRAECDRDRAVSRAGAAERDRDRQIEDAKVAQRRLVAKADQCAARLQDQLEKFMGGSGWPHWFASSVIHSGGMVCKLCNENGVDDAEGRSFYLAFLMYILKLDEPAAKELAVKLWLVFEKFCEGKRHPYGVEDEEIIAFIMNRGMKVVTENAAGV